jgi:hypothetical protein
LDRFIEVDFNIMAKTALFPVEIENIKNKPKPINRLIHSFDDSY